MKQSKKKYKHRLEISWNMEFYTQDGSRYLTCHMMHGCIIGSLQADEAALSSLTHKRPYEYTSDCSVFISLDPCELYITY